MGLCSCDYGVGHVGLGRRFVKASMRGLGTQSDGECGYPGLLKSCIPWVKCTTSAECKTNRLAVPRSKATQFQIYRLGACLLSLSSLMLDMVRCGVKSSGLGP